MITLKKLLILERSQERMAMIGLAQVRKFLVMFREMGRVMGKMGKGRAAVLKVLAILVLPAPATLFSALLQKASIKIAASFLHQLQPGQSPTAPKRGAPRTYKIKRTLSMCRLILITPAWAGIALAPQMKILI